MRDRRPLAAPLFHRGDPVERLRDFGFGFVAGTAIYFNRNVIHVNAFYTLIYYQFLKASKI